MEEVTFNLYIQVSTQCSMSLFFSEWPKAKLWGPSLLWWWEAWFLSSFFWSSPNESGTFCRDKVSERRPFVFYHGTSVSWTCIPSKFICWSLTPQCDSMGGGIFWEIIWFRVGHEGGALVMRMILSKEERQEPSVLVCCVRTCQYLQARKRISH